MVANEIKIRNAEPADHPRILTVMPEWWGGRDVTALLPELFIVHFANTCFVAEQNGELVGFLVGFLSQAHPQEAYIHFVGVHPAQRQAQLGRTLYEQFFAVCRAQQRTVIRACTSLVNTGSVSFHTRMGFQVDRGDSKFFFTKQLGV